MNRIAVLAWLLLAAPAAAADETPFHPSSETFADANACRSRLAAMVAEQRRLPHVGTAGPYSIAPGDVRVHWVDVSGSGHRITEHRCLAEKLSGRSWRQSMDGSDGEAAETIETMAAKAEWLKKAPGQEQ